MNTQTKHWKDYLGLVGWAILLIFLARLSLLLAGEGQAVFHRLSPQGWIIYPIWGLALWQGLVVLIPWSKNSQTFKRHYQQFLASDLWRFYLFQGVLFLSWIFDIYLSVMIFSLLNAQILIRITQVISMKPVLRSRPWNLKYPIGALTGTMLGFSLWAFYSYAISIGLNNQHLLALILMVLGLIALAAGTFYLYVKYGNPALVPPVLIYLASLLFNHLPGATVKAQEPWVFYSIVFLLVGLTLLYGRYSYIQWKEATAKDKMPVSKK